MVTILFFAQLSESAGQREVRLELHETSMSVKAVAEQALKILPARLSDDLFDGTVLVAVNKQRADWQTVVKSGDEVAFLPPVSGG